jgi:hypothetical protein
MTRSSSTAPPAGSRSSQRTRKPLSDARPTGAGAGRLAHLGLVRAFAAAVVISVVVLALAPPNGRGGQSRSGVTACGIERWPVKTLTDPRARLVDFRARRTTVAALRRLHPPPLYGPRLRGVETSTYRVRARLVVMKLEDDGDIHLVLADPSTGRTMIAESPAPGCTPSDSQPHLSPDPPCADSQRCRASA